MVPADEEAWGGQGAASLSAQGSPLQPGQCGAERRCWATHQQWQPTLHRLPRPGGHALCPDSRLWGCVRSSGLLPDTRWASPAWCSPLRWGLWPGQDPGGGPLHCQPLPLPGWERGGLQWVEVCSLRGGPLVPHGLFGLHHHLHHWHPHVGPKLRGSCLQRLCLILPHRTYTDRRSIWELRLGSLTPCHTKWNNSKVSVWLSLFSLSFLVTLTKESPTPFCFFLLILTVVISLSSAGAPWSFAPSALPYRVDLSGSSRPVEACPVGVPCLHAPCHGLTHQNLLSACVMHRPRLKPRPSSTQRVHFKNFLAKGRQTQVQFSAGFSVI